MADRLASDIAVPWPEYSIVHGELYTTIDDLGVFLNAVCNGRLGHDGGTRVRVRLLFDGSLEHDTYVFVYLTNGSATNVWSRTLIDSVIDVAMRDGR